MILGSMAEENFGKAIIVCDSDGVLEVFIRPIEVVMMGVIAITLDKGVTATFSDSPRAAMDLR
jgi:TctA family transporter